MSTGLGVSESALLPDLRCALYSLSTTALPPDCVTA